MTNTMFTRTYSLLKKIYICNRQRTITKVATKEVEVPQTDSFRTLEAYPQNHTISHTSKIYTLPSDVTQILYNCVPNEWKQQIKIFAECGILIRKPAVELITYLEQTDYTKPINRYVLYGKTGVGKTTTMMHLLHYGIEKKFILLHLPWVNIWYRFPKEVVESAFMPDKFDLPFQAQLFLQHFKRLNNMLLSELDLKVSKDYTWSQRESTKSGEQLVNLIEFGIQRVKFACGVIDALVNELKAASTAGKCRVMIFIDGFNAFTNDSTSINYTDKKCLPADKISLTITFYNSVNYDWCNGAAILSVDTRATKNNRDSEYPKYLLGKKGFEFLDPFLPICINNYTFEEFNTIIEYYTDRKWIRNITPEGKRELELLSNKNPFSLWLYCKPL